MLAVGNQVEVIAETDGVRQPLQNINAETLAASLLRAGSVRRRAVGTVELAPAGDRVSDASAADGVCRLYNDKGSLLQRGHSEVLCVIHWLQEAAIAGP